MNKKIAVFSTQYYDKESFDYENQKYKFEVEFFNSHLCSKTAEMIQDVSIICTFVNDDLSRATLLKLKEKGVRLIALRCAGFNNLDISAANELEISVVRVPSYSPYAVAEHALALILALNRKIHKAYNRTREGNFSIHGLMGFDLHAKTVGLIGTGQIGTVMAQILKGFGCNIIAYDPYSKSNIEHVHYVSLRELFAASDIISMHCPLTPETHHMINKNTINEMKPGVMLINTSRGGVIDTKAVIAALKKNHIGYLGLDVYEEEEHIFHEDLSEYFIKDDVLARLLTFPNVIITGHQAFFTQEAINNIAKTTFENINEFFENENKLNKKQLTNLVL